MPVMRLFPGLELLLWSPVLRKHSDTTQSVRSWSLEVFFFFFFNNHSEAVKASSQKWKTSLFAEIRGMVGVMQSQLNVQASARWPAAVVAA